METRVAILEHMAAETKEDIRDLRTTLRDLANEMREGFRRIDGKIERLGAKFDTEFDSLQRQITVGNRWTIGLVFTVGLAGLALSRGSPISTDTAS